MGNSPRVRWLWLLLLACSSGCIDRSRINADCEWARDSAFQLDLARPADRQHLIADAQLAEELMVRYADTEHKRRFGYTGHGGLIEHGRVGKACLATLVAVIERDHGVTAAQIDWARAQRDPRFDVPVMLAFAAIYAFAAAFVVAWLRRRFVDASPLVAMTATALSSIGFSGLGIQVGAVWTGIWECVRIGDDHLGVSRLARAPWEQHLGELFVAGIALFWIVAAVRWRVANDSEASIDVADHVLSG